MMRKTLTGQEGAVWRKGRRHVRMALAYSEEGAICQEGAVWRAGRQQVRRVLYGEGGAD